MITRRRQVWAGALALAVVVPAVLLGPAGAASADDERDTKPVTQPAQATVRVAAASTDSLALAASARVSEMSLRDKAASVVMAHISTTDPTALHDFMSRTGVGGFILMGSNIPGDETELRAITAALTSDPAVPPLIGIDQEGGDVSRLPWDHFAAAVTLKSQEPAAAQRAFAGRGALVQRAGIGVNFGIVADVTPQSGSFIFRRSMGWPPIDAAARVGAAVTGEGSQALSTLKHFPGHGAAAGDSHSSIPTTDKSFADWQASDAVPFVAGLEADAPLVMFGHLAFTAVDPAPASLSAEWHRVLREDLGFTGVAVTDDLGMLQASGIPEYRDPVANSVAALAAGNDLVLGVMFSDASTADKITDGIVAAVEAGTLPAARLDEAATRVMTLRLQLAGAGRGMVPCADCTAAD